MRPVTLLLAASMLSIAAFSTHAVTIHNNESSAQVLRIVENGQEQQIQLQPSTSATDLCATKCDLYIGNDPDPYEVSAADSLVIENGELYDAGEPSQGGTTPKQ